MDRPKSFAFACLALGLTFSATGCMVPDGGGVTASRSMMPSFLLSEKEKAQRNLKDPAALNLKYATFQEQIGQKAEARKSYELVLRDEPKSIEAVLGIARLDQLAEKTKEAESGYQHALKMKPHDPAVLAACGQFYASQKQWPQAFETLNGAVAAAPRVSAYKRELAIAKIKSGDVDGGYALFAELVGPDKAHYNVAHLLKQDGKPEAAAAQCRLALAINPRLAPALAMLNEISPQSQAAVAKPRRDKQQVVRVRATAPANERPRAVVYPESDSDAVSGAPPRVRSSFGPN